MTIIQIIANILSFIGNSLFTISAILKSKTKIVLFQTGNYIFAIVAEAMASAWAGLAQEAVALLRNIILLFVKDNNKIAKLVVSVTCVLIGLVVGVILNITLNHNAWFGYLPIAGSLIYSSVVILVFMISMNPVNAELTLKYGLLVNSVLWATYGWFSGLYPIMGFNIVNIILCIISIVRAYKIKNTVIEVDNA
ncbi:MAG: YgjV family protein, partial [Acholeplasmatales bacterium]|nr:YgjV family protein [Acholeplasmatales bacterium]